jgi:hypothetical protein
VLKYGDTIASLTTASVNSECRSWLTEAIFMEAGYVLREQSVDPREVKLVCHVLQSADAMFIVMYDTRIIMASRRVRVTSRIYARPNGKRARAAALLLCAAHRFDRGSTLAPLTRDAVRLLAQAVCATRFDIAWL